MINVALTFRATDQVDGYARAVTGGDDGVHAYPGGARPQDMAVTDSMGPIYARHREHLGTTDQLIIRTRRRLLNAVKAHTERGITPPGVDDPEVYRVRSGGVFLPMEADWVEATKELRKAFVEHPELDPMLNGPL